MHYWQTFSFFIWIHFVSSSLRKNNSPSFIMICWIYFLKIHSIVFCFQCLQMWDQPASRYSCSVCVCVFSLRLFSGFPVYTWFSAVWLVLYLGVGIVCIFPVRIMLILNTWVEALVNFLVIDYYTPYFFCPIFIFSFCPQLHVSEEFIVFHRSPRLCARQHPCHQQLYCELPCGKVCNLSLISPILSFPLSNLYTSNKSEFYKSYF
jgi:hypothetical protein